MIAPRHRYQSEDEDSGRWKGFPYRDGDIVISTRSKSGTTWMQMICALLVLRDPDLPKPLSEISPWLDWLITPRDNVVAILEAQTHRRFIKTHTPLDGLPLDNRATYIVVARHPLDMAISLYHQGANIDVGRLRELTGHPADPDSPPRPRPAADEWLRGWIHSDAAPEQALDSIRGVFWHLSDAWQRKDAGNVILMRYEDMLADLHGQMATLADRLGISVPRDEIEQLAEHASFSAMKDRSRMLAPDPAGVLVDKKRFFRRGSSGAGETVASPDDLAAYQRRAAELAPADLFAWLHPRHGSSRSRN